MGLKCIIKALINLNGPNDCGRISWIVVECRLNKCCLRSTMRAVCVRRISVCATSSSQVGPRAALWIFFEQLLLLSCKLVLSSLLPDYAIRTAYTSSSPVVHVAGPRVHDPLELCHIIRVKIWVNICPPSFLIVRPMRKLLRPVPSAVLSIRTFSALKNEIL